jgi:hypothetical protein
MVASSSSSASCLMRGRLSAGQRRMPGTLVGSAAGGSRPMACTSGLSALSAALQGGRRQQERWVKGVQSCCGAVAAQRAEVGDPGGCAGGGRRHGDAALCREGSGRPGAAHTGWQRCSARGGGASSMHGRLLRRCWQLRARCALPHLMPMIVPLVPMPAITCVTLPPVCLQISAPAWHGVHPAAGL